MGCCGKIASGVSGLAKVAAQSVGIAVDEAPPDEVQKRRDQCRDCEFATRSAKPKFKANKGLTTLSQCSVCSCIIAAKTKIASETCPLPIRRWGPVTPLRRQSW